MTTSFHEYIKSLNTEQIQAFCILLLDLEFVTSDSFLDEVTNALENGYDVASFIGNELLAGVENGVTDSLKLDFLGEDKEMSVVGCIVDLLTFNNLNIKELRNITIEQEVMVINPLPQTHYFSDNFEPEKLYFQYDSKIYQINITSYLGNCLRYRVEYPVANFILEKINSAHRIYLVDSFSDDICLYFSAKKSIIESSEIPLPFVEKVDNVNDLFDVYDLTNEYNLINPYFDKIVAKQKVESDDIVIDIVSTKSMTSTDALGWLVDNIDKIRRLTTIDDSKFNNLFVDNSFNTIEEKTIFIYNLFIAITRQLIADPRVIHDKHKKYPLLDKYRTTTLLLHFANDFSKVNELLFSAKHLSAMINHREDSEIFDKIYFDSE